MWIRRHLQPNHSTGIDIDDDALDLEDLRVARQWILPGFERRMRDGGMDKIHLTPSAAVVLERGNFFRVGRPEQDRTIAAAPTGVIGRVAKILYPVLGELCIGARCEIPDP